MNTHPDLQTMIRKETTNPNPRQAAKALLGKAPEGESIAVLYADRHRTKWVVAFTDNAPQAARMRFNGLPAVATAPVSRRPPSDQEDPGTAESHRHASTSAVPGS